MNNLIIALREEMQNEYNEYTYLYNQLAEKLEGLGASDDIFDELSQVCIKALNINLDIMCYRE